MKKEYIVLALVIVALSAYLYFKQSDSTHYTLPALEDISDMEITKIDIAKKDQLLTLVKEGDAWTVGTDRFPAEKSQVSPMIDVIKQLKLTALVSESDNYARYELGDANKISITAWSNDTAVRKFDMGKAAASYRHTFVRIDGDKRVYHADENFRSKFDKTESRLTDKTVLTFDTETAYSVQASTDGKTIAVERKQEEVNVDVTPETVPSDANASDASAAKEPPKAPEIVWVASDGKHKDTAAITDFIKSVSSLKCESYISGKKKEDLKDPVHEITVKGDKDYTLSVFKADDTSENYPAVSSESAFPFYLDKESLDKIVDAMKKI